MIRILVLAAIAVVCSACTTSQQADQLLATKYQGTPSDNFFRRFGPPASSYKLNNGNTLFTWQERARHIETGGTATTTVYGNTAYTSFSPGGTITLQCQLKIEATAAGKITNISVLADSLGMWQMSRCNEFFSRKA